MRSDPNLGAFSLPFLGVALVLLLSVLQEPLYVRESEIQLPSTAAPTYLLGEKRVLHITIKRGWTVSGTVVPARYWIGRTRYDREEFLRQLAQEKPSSSRRALVTADSRLQFGEIVATMDALGSAGFERAFLIAAGPDQIFVFDLLNARSRGGILEAGTVPATISSTQPHNSALQPPGAPGS